MSNLASAIEITTVDEAVVLSDMGVYDKGSALYTFASSQAAPQAITAYRSTAHGIFGSWFAQDKTHEAVTPQQITATCRFGDIIYLAFFDGSRALNLYSFNLATNLYAVIATGGPSHTLNPSSLALNRLSTGDFVMTYEKGETVPFPSNGRYLYTVIYNGAWGTPILVDSVPNASSKISLAGTVQDPSDNVHIIYQRFVFLAGFFVDPVHARLNVSGIIDVLPTVMAPGGGNTISWGRGAYASATDQVIFAAVTGSGGAAYPDGVYAVIISDPTGTPTYSSELIQDGVISGDAYFGWDNPCMLYAGNGDWLAVVTSSPSTMAGPWNRYSYFRRTGGVWSASDTTIWDGSVDTSDPPSTNGEAPATFRLLSDGVTIGIAFPQLAFSIFGGGVVCGIVYYTDNGSGVILPTIPRGKKMGRYWKGFRGRAG